MQVILDNKRLRIYDLVLLPQSTFLLQLSHSAVTWQVGSGTHRETRENEEITSFVEDKTVTFYSPNQSTRITNEGNGSYRRFVFEFLIPPIYSEEQFQALLSRAIYSTKVGDEIIFENQFCRVWRLVIPPGGGSKELLHQHVVDYVFVPYGPGPIKLVAHDANSEITNRFEFKDGEPFYAEVPNGGYEEDGVTFLQWPIHWPENGSNDLEFVEALVELK